jgi:DNA polymerase III subunit epsilon
VFLVFDVETTGLPKSSLLIPEELHKWPRLVQLSWVLVQGDQIVEEHDYIIKPNGFSIPTFVSYIHGITTARAKKEGHELKEVLAKFTETLLGNSQISLVAHNISFDHKIVGSEIMRIESTFFEQYMALNKICTMKASASYCNFKNKKNPKRKKWPNLQELHYKLFGENFEGAHNALNDAKACARCFIELKKLGVLQFA